MKLRTQDKRFKHIGTPIELPELSDETTDAGRWYTTPDGNRYPSITTILKQMSEGGIQQWTKRVGEQEADKQRAKASLRGTGMHLLCEYYIDNVRPYLNHGTPGQKFLFNAIKKDLNRIDNVQAQEVPLYSDRLRVAGRVDCIGEFDQIPSIIDFKTSKKPKKIEHITNYFLQATFYSLAYQELTGVKVSNLVIIIAIEDGRSQVFMEDRKKFIMPLAELALTRSDR